MGTSNGVGIRFDEDGATTFHFHNSLSQLPPVLLRGLKRGENVGIGIVTTQEIRDKRLPKPNSKPHF